MLSFVKICLVVHYSGLCDNIYELNMNTQLLLRPIRFPLKLKLISLFSLVLLTSLAAYAHYALTRFIEDKSAYIFSSVQEVSTAQSKAISQVVDEAKRTINILAYMPDAQKAKNIFESFPAFIDYREFDLKDNKYTTGIADEAGLLRNDINKDNIEAALASVLPQYKLESTDAINIDYLFHSKPILTLYRRNQKKLQIAQLSLSEVLNSRSDSIKSYLISPGSMPLLSIPQEQTDELFEIIKSKFLKLNLKRGVVEANTSNQLSLIAFQTSQKDYPLTVAVIEKAKAFSVADSLIEKSYIFAVFLLSIAIIIGILFSRTLTKSLETLFEGTQKFVSGDFTSRVDVKSRDEIGALSDSFNYMGKKIVEFVEQMKEKVRLEREVEVAKLVQDSFFPQDEGSLNGVQFSAFYAPASECGGDWWGHIEKNGNTIIFIADATGHGVPAALITATANCALHTLEEVLKTNEDLANKPELMLAWFNKAICGAGKQLYMTMLCLVIDPKNKVLTWANAAHNPALLLAASLEDPKRQDLKPLLSKPSPHLGKNFDSTFEASSVDYSEEDILVLMTDGINENTDPKGSAYGDRRFHQSIIDGKNTNLRVWRSFITDAALTYSGGTPSDDDVTLVLCKLSDTVQKQDIEIYSEDAVISHLEAKEGIEYLYNNPQINHLIGFNSPILESELANEEPLETQFQFEWTGTDIGGYRDAISHFLQKQDFPGWFQSPRDYLTLIGDELVTNAFDPQGTKVNVRLSVKDQRIIIEVEDNRGELKKDTLLKAFKRAHETQAPKPEGRGAGLGLYLVYQSTNQIWINVNKNKSTSVKCILEATKRYKNFKGRITSFHFSSQENT